MDKAIVALVMAVANIFDLVGGGEGWWSNLKEEEVGVTLNVLLPILVWLVPSGWFAGRFGR